MHRRFDMSNDTVVRARINSDIKTKAMKALDAMGLTISDAIRLLLLRVAEEEELPFVVKVPNAATVRAMKELEDGGGTRHGSVEEMFKDFGI